MNHVQDATNELKKNQKLLLDAEAALKAKQQQSQALESEIQALCERVRQRNVRVDKNREEIERGKAQVVEIWDQMSI